MLSLLVTGNVATTNSPSMISAEDISDAKLTGDAAASTLLTPNDTTSIATTENATIALRISIFDILLFDIFYL